MMEEDIVDTVIAHCMTSIYIYRHIHCNGLFSLHWCWRTG